MSKSIIEHFELKTGAEVYIQGSGVGGKSVVVSFDSSATNFAQYIDVSEAEKLAEILIKVAKEVRNGKA